VKDNQDYRLMSFTAADAFPAKVLQLPTGDRIRPVHIQLNPTNRCNLKCSFCSCSEREKTDEMPLAEIAELLTTFAAFGSRSVTITGGGEPLMHPHINEIIEHAKVSGIQVGIVSNGLLMDRLDHQWPLWVRVSASDDRAIDQTYFDTISRAVDHMPSTDWAFSYVLTARPDYVKLAAVMAFAADQTFTHVRLVSDLLDLENVPDIEQARQALTGLPGESLVIYQGRKEYTGGRRQCLISLLKPGIAADGLVYPCCGAQYALEPPPRDYRAMSMGHWRDFAKHLSTQQPFNGSACVHCYYDNYNTVLAARLAPLQHEAFV